MATFEEGGERYDVRVRLEESQRDALDELGLIQVRGHDGGLIDLENVARLEEASGPALIERRDRSRQVVVYANTPPELALGTAIARLERIVAEESLPAGYSGIVEGEADRMRESAETDTNMREVATFYMGLSQYKLGNYPAARGALSFCTNPETTQAYPGMLAEAWRMLADANKLEDRAFGEKSVLAKIATMPEPDRGMAKQIHAIVKEAAPSLMPRTWYGMPAYTRDGKVVCFFQSGHQYKTRYCTFGFQEAANLDDGAMWPMGYALKRITAAEEARITDLVKKAVRQG